MEEATREDNTANNPTTRRAAINSLSECCRAGGKAGCLMRYFPENDYDAAERYVATHSSRGINSENFVVDVVRSTVDTITEGPKQKRLVQTFTIPPVRGTGIGRKDRLPVCAKCFKVVYGITDQEYRNVSASLKQAASEDMDGGRLAVRAGTHKIWKDDYIHNFTYAEGEAIYRKHIANCTVAGILIMFFINLL